MEAARGPPGRLSPVLQPPLPDGSPPGWFRRAVALAPVSRVTRVDGCSIHSLSWGDVRKRTLVLVHGGAAHAYWWSFIGPLFLPNYHVVAVDLSGHGDSGHRGRYSFRGWAAEVIGVGGGAGSDLPAVVLAHSMSGIVAALAAEVAGHRLAGTIVVDVPLEEPEPAAIGDAETIFRATKTYPTKADAQRRFRILPPQPVHHAALVEHVAAHSIRLEGSGWTWKFDPSVFAARLADRPADVGTVLMKASCPLAAIVGERSSVVPEVQRERLRRLTSPAGDGRDHAMLEIDGGYHHLMFDRPVELVAAVGSVLARWGLPAVDPADG